MAIQKPSKINQLEQNLAEGMLADAAWFKLSGYLRALQNQYVKVNRT